MKEKLKEYGVYAAKGFTIGAAMTVPGISGGTLALIMDIYDKLLLAVATLFKKFKKNVIFLAVVAVSLLVGMFALSKLILFLLEIAPAAVRLFFIGAILGGVPMLYMKTGQKRFRPLSLIYILLGAGAVLSLSLIPRDVLDLSGSFDISQIPGFLIAGLGLAVALIAPGISFSHMLLVFGIYERFFDAIGSLDIGFLVCILLPAGLFTLALIKGMEYALTKRPFESYSVILGFVLGSLKDILKLEDGTFIALPEGWMIPATILAFAAGAVLVYAVTRKDVSKKEIVQ